MRETSVVEELVRARWAEWSRLRFTPGERRERKAWAQFVASTARRYHELQMEATSAGASLDYTVWHVRKFVLAALEESCKYCMHLFGIESWAMTYIVPPRRGGRELYRLRNMTVCCQRCGDAKGMLSECEWIDVLSSLRGADEVSAADVLDRLIAGKLDLPVGTRREGGQGQRVYVIRTPKHDGQPAAEGPKVLPHPRRLRVTRKPQSFASCRAKK